MVVVALTAVPPVVKSAHVGGPAWLLPVVTVAAGVLLTLWKPLLAAFSDTLTARMKSTVEREARNAAVLRRLPGSRGKPQRVEEAADRGRLNIHQAIPLPGGAGEGLSEELPQYVTRDIDADLRNFLTARSVTGGFALLVGPTAAGKTRTAYEAVRAVMPRWRMVMLTGAEINGLVTDRADLTRSVIWLNETQDFLTSSDPLTDSSVRRLLADSARPVILIGTIWSDRYDQLRTPPAPGGTTHSPGGAEADATGGAVQAEDLGRNAREVLAQARVFSMSVFSGGEWDRADELRARDPRLAQALAHRDSGLGMTQILAATPELIHRWEQADNPYGKAVLTAAVTAARCGHPDTIPTPVLKALTEHFLTGTQRANATPAWYEDALAWACRPVHHSGTIAPLRSHAPQTAGPIDGHRVSDILTNHTAPTSPATTAADTPHPVWDILTTTSAPDALRAIGRTAYYAGHIPQAHTAWTRATQAGDTGAMYNLGFLARQEGHIDQARTWWTQAANHGNATAMTSLGVLAHRQGDTGQARAWWTQAAEHGNTDAMTSLGVLARQEGDTDQARTWYTQAANHGNATAMYNLGVLAHRQGDTGQARAWWTQAAEHGNTDAMTSLGVLARQEGDTDQARTWYTQAANHGNATAMYNLGVLAHRQGDTGQARAWWTQAAEHGNTDAMTSLGALAHRQGDTDQARAWWTQAAEHGDTDAVALLAELPDD